MTQRYVQRRARAITTSQGQFNEDLHAAFTALSVPTGQLQERINSATGLTGGAAYNAMLAWQIGTLGPQALLALAGFTTNASIYTPGEGVSDSITPANWSDTLGTVPAVVNGPVARVNAQLSGANSQQAVLAKQPTLRLASSQYSWEFAGASAQVLTLSAVPFQMTDDHCVIAAGQSTLATGTRTIFGTSGAGTQRIAAITFSAGAPSATWRDDATTTVQLVSDTGITSANCLITARQVGQSRILRVNGVQKGASTTTLGATTLTGAALGAFPDSTNPLTGFIGQVFIIKGTVTDDQMMLLELAAAARSGITLPLIEGSHHGTRPSIPPVRWWPLPCHDYFQPRRTCWW